MTDVALITTTINVPNLLLEYARDAKNHGRAIKMVVSGDRKTPPEAAELCARVTRETGIECEYMAVAAQEALMRAYPRLNGHLPWNCVQRRNVAILRAAAQGADVVVTIDDDNFVACEDYFGGHEVTGTRAELETYGTGGAGQWFNVCRFLREGDGRRFFARGYGIAARRVPDGDVPAPVNSARRVAVNAGLWLGDPDIDAATRIASPVEAVEYTRAGRANFFVETGAWTPFNSQNTAIARFALPAYFLSPYVGRYDDIFISYFVKRIADHLGDGVAFGQPLVRQDRNAHDLLADLALEWLGTKITDELIAALEGVTLAGRDYGTCLVELADGCEEALRECRMTLPERAQTSAFFAGCRMWAELPLWQGV